MILILVNTLFITIIKHSKQVLFSLMQTVLDNEQVGEEVYISMINKAEKYCWFMTPYLIITDEMTHALCLAAKRGVDVRIITPGIPDKNSFIVTRSFYHGLVKHGVRVYEWTLVSVMQK